MKTGYYVTQNAIVSDASSIGVYKKVKKHIKYFNNFFNMKLLLLERNTSLKSKILCRLPFQSVDWNYDEVLANLVNPSFVYIRRFNLDLLFLTFLKQIKLKYPACKIIIEIYTYPYDYDEYFRSFTRFIRVFPFYLKDAFFRYKQKKYVDRFVTYTPDEFIFGVKTINTVNGIIVDDILPVEPQSSDNSVHMISVAHMQPHHGYERIIEGMRNYYNEGNNTRNVYFHIVGDGSETVKYKKLVSTYKLDKYVIFYGKLQGKELGDIYNKCNIGVCSFGFYKYHLMYASSLKIPEYLAKGLPIIAGSEISVLGNDKIHYCLQFSNNATPINVDEVVKFYDSIYSNSDRMQVISSIRAYAKEKFDETVAMKPIIDYIET